MEEDEDTYVPRISWGDLSAIVVAGCFSLLCLGLIIYMFLGGHPLAGIVGAPNGDSATSSPEAAQADAPMHLAPGEVRVAVPPKPKNPPPKP
jgi:hypothetical protein